MNGKLTRNSPHLPRLQRCNGRLNATRIYIGKPRISKRGPLYCARLGSPEGPVLVRSTLEPLLAGARALLARGITGQAELWDDETPYARISGDIEELAKLTVREDETTSPTFVRWRAFPAARQRSRKPESGSGLSPYPKNETAILARPRAANQSRAS